MSSWGKARASRLTSTWIKGRQSSSILRLTATWGQISTSGRLWGGSGYLVRRQRIGTVDGINRFSRLDRGRRVQVSVLSIGVVVEYIIVQGSGWGYSCT